MSVVVESLTKEYGTQRAVDDLSFQARPGEVLGFLGPNGAGKSTTMKIITCYLPASAGNVEVCGHNVATDSLAVRRCIGYLPEHNPIYPDMYVREYLQFAGRLHDTRIPRSRIDEMIEMTGLEREQHKLIGALSKGYRQRVGLAQAMLHDPQVLILDEPTSGLDPNQLAEIRELIKKLGREKTVIFSTHIMQEVQAICDRVLIINSGRIVADDPINRLQARIRGESAVTLEWEGQLAVESLQTIAGVSRTERLGPRRYRLFSSGGKDIRADVFRFAVSRGLTLLELRQEEKTVEDVFRHLTAGRPEKPEA